MTSCCLTGHRQIEEGDLPRLTAHIDAALLALYQGGCRTFYAGGAMGFDTLAAERVLALRAQYADVRLHLLLPCRSQAEKWPQPAQRRYETLRARCDSFSYISEHYDSGAMQRRNLALVAQASLCLAFLQREGSGAGQTVRAAKKAGMPVINLADRLPQKQTGSPCQ